MAYKSDTIANIPSTTS